MSRSQPAWRSASHMTSQTSIIFLIALLGLTASASHAGGQTAAQAPSDD